MDTHNEHITSDANTSFKGGLARFTHVYFIGIGGIGMSALARYFHMNGKKVSGYDKTPSSVTDQLEAIGISIHFNDSVLEIPSQFLNAQKTVIIYTPAIPQTHKEYTHFKTTGYVLLKRAEVLGMITKDTFCLAVAGTHGKTTTSALLGHIMQPEQATAFLGGIAGNYQSNLILGEDKTTIVEADEFDRSFLQLAPNIACITSMDADHLDIYGSHSALQASFNEFANKVSDALLVAKGLPVKGMTYAIESEADYMAHNIRIADGTYVFDVKTPTSNIQDVVLPLAGKHNVMNALAALAMATLYGVSFTVIKQQLADFKGVKRRFSYKIKTDNLVLIDDYAHHPTEIKAVHDSVREMYPEKKVLVVFQPHLFTRTRDFATDFAKTLSMFDELLLLPIYPAREQPIENISSEALLDTIPLKTKQLTSKQHLVEDMSSSDADIFVMLGAGDIGLLVDEVVAVLLKNNEKSE